MSDDIFDKLNTILNLKRTPKFVFIFVFGFVFGIWLLSGIYTIKPSEQGLVLQFGRYHHSTSPGLHYHIPYPIQSVIKQDVTTIQRTEIGRTDQEGLILTSDENIVELNYNILWCVNEPVQFLFAVAICSFCL